MVIRGNIFEYFWRDSGETAARHRRDKKRKIAGTSSGALHPSITRIAGQHLSSPFTMAATNHQPRWRHEEESQIASLLQRLILPQCGRLQKVGGMALNGTYGDSPRIAVLRCGGCVLDASSTAMREVQRSGRSWRVVTTTIGIVAEEEVEAAARTI